MPFTPLKVMLRGLPPDITTEAIQELLLSGFPDAAARPSVAYLERGKLRTDKPNVPSRCCLDCPVYVDDAHPVADTSVLFDKLASLPFKTEHGSGCGSVSLPPYPKLPRPDEAMPKDPRDGTIDTDADFKKFATLYETLVANQSAGKAVNWASLRDLPLSVSYPASRMEPRAKPTTPAASTLVQYLIEKKQKKRSEQKAKAKKPTKGGKPDAVPPKAGGLRPDTDPKRTQHHNKHGPASTASHHETPHRHSAHPAPVAPSAPPPVPKEKPRPVDTSAKEPAPVQAAFAAAFESIFSSSSPPAPDASAGRGGRGARGGRGGRGGPRGGGGVPPKERGKPGKE